MEWRVKLFCIRLLDYVIRIPLRVFRFIRCLLGLQPFHGRHKVIRWLAGSFLLFLDITPIPILLECIADWIKFRTRPLEPEELRMASDVFGNSIPLNLIGIDPGSIVINRFQAYAYVSLHTINHRKRLLPHTFIHELVHIWQYRKFGAIYISECIWAQHWGGGYNYGGILPLQNNVDKKGLAAFNYEQQAEIIEDYFRIKNDLPLQWSAQDLEIEHVLERYMLQLRAK